MALGVIPNEAIRLEFLKGFVHKEYGGDEQECDETAYEYFKPHKTFLESMASK